MSAKSRVAALLLGPAIKLSTAAARYSSGESDLGFPTNNPLEISGYEIVPDNVTEFVTIEPAGYALLGYGLFGNKGGKGLKGNILRTLSAASIYIGIREAAFEISNYLGYLGPHGYNPAEGPSLIPFSLLMALGGAAAKTLVDRAHEK